MRKILPIELSPKNIHWLDFTAANTDLETVDLKNTSNFSSYVFGQIPKNKIGIGGWLENRAIYHRSRHFQKEEEPRTIHLGLDLWTAAFTPIFVPMEGKIHSFQNNEGFGDYGPTIIIEHNDLEFGTIYTLYGHLSLQSIASLKTGQEFKVGDQIAEIGPFPENGDWPPHLHFQVMKNLEGMSGDYPGVCSQKDLPHFRDNCIDPLRFLGIKKEQEN